MGRQLMEPPVALQGQGENSDEVGECILGFCLPEGVKYETADQDN